MRWLAVAGLRELGRPARRGPGLRLPGRGGRLLTAVYLVAVALHVLAAVTWVGGSVFLVAALGPVLRRPELRAQAPLLMRTAGLRFRRLTHVAWAVFIVTGAVLLAHRGFLLTPVLVSKLLLVGAAFAISSFHDFKAGPAAAAAARRGDVPAAGRWRRRAAWLGRVNLLVMGVVVVLSVGVARGF